MKTKLGGTRVHPSIKLIWGAIIQLALMSLYLMIPTTLGAVEDKPAFRESGMLIYDAIVQGRSVRCVVDTGSTKSILDADVCGLGVPQGKKTEKFQTNSAIIEMQTIDDISISLNGNPNAVISSQVFNLKAFDEVLGQKIGAVVGMDLLSNQVLSIVDGEPKIVTSVHERFSRTSVTQSSYQNRSRPQLPIQLPIYGTHNFQVDTGFNAYLIITDKLAQALIRSQRAVFGIEQESFTADGLHVDRDTIIQEIEIAGVVFRNVPASRGKLNCIGMGLLTYLDLAVDFQNRRVYLDSESSRSASEFPQNASGIGFVYISSEAIIVGSIRNDSPASRAEVQAGDEVLSIDGKKPADLSLEELMQIVSREGQTIHIAFRRSGRYYDRDLTLKRNFEYPPTWAIPTVEESGFLEFLEKEAEE